jgi:hypothetical protein
MLGYQHRGYRRFNNCIGKEIRFNKLDQRTEGLDVVLQPRVVSTWYSGLGLNSSGKINQKKTDQQELVLSRPQVKIVVPSV